MKHTVLCLFAALLITACTQQPLPEASYDVIPLPKEVTLNQEKPFVLQPSTVVYYEEALHCEAEFLSQYVNDILSFEMKCQPLQGEVKDGIVLQIVPDDFDHAEAYEINVTPKQVIIKGADAAGVFYGIQTLRKSLSSLTSHLSPLTFHLPCG